MGRIAGGEFCPPTVPTIWDLRGTDFVLFDIPMAKDIIAIRNEFPVRLEARIAYVVPNQLGYGMMRILQSRTDGGAGSLVCYDYEEAERWVAASQPVSR